MLIAPLPPTANGEENPAAASRVDPDPHWRSRETYWRRKLGRIRLGVEPIEEQLTRYRRVTWGLTAVPSALAVMFVSLFSAFGRPDIGVILVAILLLPIVACAWLDYGLLRRRVRRYLAEEAAHIRDQDRATPPSVPSNATVEPA